jgi:murein DD-endopeptidase MepM/ murein hydrolase activator NlpD
MATSLPSTELASTLGQDARLKGLAGRLQALKPADSDSKASGGNHVDRAQLREASQDFEAMFINMLMKEMWPEEEEGEGLFNDGSTASGIYRDMFNTELSRVMSRSGQLGLAETIEQQVAEMLGLKEGENGIIPGEVLERALPQPIRRGVARVYEAVEQSAAGAAERLLRPLTDGWISSGYGMRKDPLDGELRQHNGVDIAASEGTPVKAAADGVVTFSGRQPGYGNMVIIEHAGGIETRYAHNSDNYVRKGEVVEKGQVIAAVGESGRATGPHLHFEVRKDGVAEDPIDFLR